MTVNSLMIDLDGTFLTAEEVEMLQHPLTGGVILFSRNFESQPQVSELCTQIRKSSKKNLLIAVDHEGGRVQRFHNEFTRLPAMGTFRHLDIAKQQILDKLTATGWILAAELLATGIDISFAPVLDVDSGISKVIGDRGFSDDPQQIIEYSTALIKGMNDAGMAATGKHFPGHGSTVADSHFELPVDPRSMQQIRDTDLSVFIALCQGGLSAIMPAHVIYPEIDSVPACFSRYLLQTILRGEAKFQGTIFSDDLSMAGAKIMGDIILRAKEALAAGCDMILCCNDKNAAVTLLDHLPQKVDKQKSARIQQMMSVNHFQSFAQLTLNNAWQQTNKMLQQLESLS